MPTQVAVAKELPQIGVTTYEQSSIVSRNLMSRNASLCRETTPKYDFSQRLHNTASYREKLHRSVLVYSEGKRAERVQKGEVGDASAMNPRIVPGSSEREKHVSNGWRQECPGPERTTTPHPLAIGGLRSACTNCTRKNPGGTVTTSQVTSAKVV